MGSWNKSGQVADLICACKGAADILGLCPYINIHRLGRWMFTAYQYAENRKNRLKAV